MAFYRIAGPALARPVNLPVKIIVLARALTIGLAYFSVAGMRGLTSSFVAILGALLMFDILVAVERRRHIGVGIIGQAARVMRPRIAGTALALAKGLGVGLFFGVAVKFGLPFFLGAIMTGGIAFTLAEKTPGTEYVGLIGGLAILEKVVDVKLVLAAGAANQTGWMELGSTALNAAVTTFVALVAGWAIGSMSGLITRLILPRGYKSATSQAYSRPLELQPFAKVVDLADGMVTTHIHVAPGSPLEHRLLAESRLSEDFAASVLGIQREGERISMPRGNERLKAGDRLLVLVPSENLELVRRLLRND